MDSPGVNLHCRSVLPRAACHFVLIGALFVALPLRGQPVVREYGAWNSPISISDAVASARSLSGLVIDGDELYVLENRPEERGRVVVLLVKGDGSVQEVTPEGFNVRTRVHEYGGGAFAVADGVIYFSNFSDGRMYAQRPGNVPKAITPPGAYRYADCEVDRRRARLICVREDHSAGPDPKKVANALVDISLADDARTLVLWNGSDFVSSPRLSPDGSSLAFITWDHPNMPWDATSLKVADLGNDGSVKRVRSVVDASDGQAVMQPSWTPDGRLMFISDRSRWWNLYRFDLSACEARAIAPLSAEIGKPAWGFGARVYAVMPTGAIAAVVTRNAADSIEIVDPAGKAIWQTLTTAFASAGALHAWKNRLVFLGFGRASAGALVELDPIDGQVRELYRPPGKRPDPEYTSTPRSIEFPGADGLPTFAWFYPPTNPQFRGPPETAPPVIVSAHGGPTSHSSPWYSAWRNFWTSRGFGVLDVNYSGSSGFGTAYRKRLNGRWGELDVRDVVAAAKVIASRGLGDSRKLIVSGGSAGGFIVLASLAFYPDVFAAGLNSFGVSDLRALAADSHKFESRYTDTLVGPLPQAANIYAERSPINAIDRIRAPLLILQGAEDKIVPPSQSEAIAEALRRRGQPVAYLLFAGEGHGFRSQEALKHAVEAHLSFVGTVLGFAPADAVSKLKIDNWPQGR